MKNYVFLSDFEDKATILKNESRSPYQIVLDYLSNLINEGMLYNYESIDDVTYLLEEENTYQFNVFIVGELYKFIFKEIELKETKKVMKFEKNIKLEDIILSGNKRIQESVFIFEECPKCGKTVMINYYERLMNPEKIYLCQKCKQIERMHTPEANEKRKNTRREKVSEDNYYKRGLKYEHREIMKEIMGRELKRNEIVHHIDGNKHNNNPDNLLLMTLAEHNTLHHKGKRYNKRKDDKD